jgi:HTH-type transcriptional regulator, transcriptional repressor of NAD biosynthesis genes
MFYTPIGFINVTALVPTVGHQHLVEFAANFMEQIGGVLHVTISVRSFEPFGSGRERRRAFEEQFSHSNVVLHDVVDDHAPQSDDGTEAFWDYWVKLAHSSTHADKIDYVFASEPYGAKYAEKLGAEFIPCDIPRETFPVKGTPVRSDIMGKFDRVMPAFRQYLAKRITIFGADSTGKTTMARRLAAHPTLGGTYLHEWARPYLECVGTEVNQSRMDNISVGQWSAQRSVLRNGKTTPFTYQDTDLLTTIGFFRIFNLEPSYDVDEMFQQVKGDLYIVMNSGIPFEPDPLRYGGDVRESSDQFWIDLLEEYKCNYYVVKATDRDEQHSEIETVLDDFARKAWYDIAEFQRD